MKLLHRRTHQSFSRKLLRWAIWLSLSLYLFFSSSSLLSNPTHRHRQTTTSAPSRALIDTTSTAGFTDDLHKHNTDRPSLRIYVYDLPSSYNRDWLSNQRCSTHLFASEVAVHQALLDSEFRTTDPDEADFFFVPVYVSCNFSTVNGFPALGHARPLLTSAVQLISSRLPFWNRSRGADHIVVASHDYGACFHAMEDAAIEDGIPSFLKRSIILQTFGVKHQHPCQDVEHVLIPPYVPPDAVRSSSSWSAPEKAKRDIWAFFRGKMEVNPKNISGRIYGKGVRTEIWHRYSGNRRFYVKRKRFDGYRSEIVRSVFCLCPRGWAPWSPRLVEAVELGCVPVIIADGIRLPFPETVRWGEISLTVAEREVGELERLLELVASTNLSAIQRNLWDPANRRALLFNRRIEEGDAMWHVLKALSGKMNGSWRWRHGRHSDFDTWKR